MHEQEVQLCFFHHEHRLYTVHLLTVEVLPFFVPFDTSLSIAKICLCATAFKSHEFYLLINLYFIPQWSDSIDKSVLICNENFGMTGCTKRSVD